MRKYLIYFLQLIIVLTSSCAKKETIYYPTSEIEFEANIVDGSRDGEAFSYYNSGQLKGKFLYRKGILHGEFKFYFENGNVEQEGNYMNGNLNGEVRFYREDGSLREKQFYDQKGRQYDYVKFTKTGMRDFRIELSKPIILTENDTIALDESFVATITLGNRRSNQLQVVLGKPTEKSTLTNKPLPMKDSVTAIVTLKSEREGLNKIEGLVIETLPDSSIALPFSYNYFVKPNRNGKII